MGPQQVLQSTLNRIGVDMDNLSDAVSLLRAQRKELSDQLDAVDKALAALGERRGVPRSSDGNPQEASETVTEVLPTRLKPPRKLSDEHRHALKEGRRKARHSKEVAAGRAREMSDPPPGLASASNADNRRPRLVKQTKR
jgi:hypothetical protein